MTSEEHLHEEDEGPEPTDEEWQHIQEQASNRTLALHLPGP